MTDEYEFLPSDPETPEIYTCQDNIELEIEPEEEVVTEMQETQNGENPQKFKGYNLTDFTEKVIVGNFKLPHSKARQMFDYLNQTTGGLIFLTLENGEKNEKNEHLHFAIANSKITPDTLKSYLRKKFPDLVNSKKGGDKKYMATYAKTLPYQVLYIFKENIGFICNIDEVNADSETHSLYYKTEYEKMNTKFSKSPAGQFYDYYLKTGGVKIGTGLDEVDIDAPYHGFDLAGPILLRDRISDIAIQYALETDNPNPGFPYLLKLINYVHLRVHKSSFAEYISNKLRKDFMH